MKLGYKLQPLNWDNYLLLVDYIDSCNFKQEFWSPIALMSWSNYGIKFYFHCLENKQAILMYTCNENKKIHLWKLTSCFYSEDIEFKSLIQTIRQDLLVLNNDSTILFSQISLSMMQDLELGKEHDFSSFFVSNYVYHLNNFKLFSGRKLQKKRNHLNYFVKNYLNVEVKNIHDVPNDKLLEFCKQHIIKHQQQLNNNELNNYLEFINIQKYKSPNFKGIVVYVDGKIEGLTLCYTRKTICEIIIEKANHDIRGIYQYLISQNLIFNNINQEYMDRQDDDNNVNLAKSKMDYHPVYVVKRFSPKNKL